MAIGSAYQRGGYVYVFDETGRTLFTQVAILDGALKGFTSSTVTIQHGEWIEVFGEKGNKLYTVGYAGSPPPLPNPVPVNNTSPATTAGQVLAPTPAPTEIDLGGYNETDSSHQTIIGMLLELIGAVALFLPSAYGLKFNNAPRSTKKGCGILVMMILICVGGFYLYRQVGSGKFSLGDRDSWASATTATNTSSLAISDGPLMKWKSNDGKVIEAYFLGLQRDGVLLKIPSTGMTHVVPLTRLSPESQQQAKKANKH